MKEESETEEVPPLAEEINIAEFMPETFEIEAVFKLKRKPAWGTVGDFMERMLDFGDGEATTNEDLSIGQEEDLDSLTNKILGGWFGEKRE